MTHEENLEDAKRLYKSANADQRYVLESLFPELRPSFSDAKVFEYVSENFIRGDGASEDVGEMGYTEAEVF